MSQRQHSEHCSRICDGGESHERCAFQSQIVDRRADHCAAWQRPELQGDLARCASREQLPIELDAEHRSWLVNQVEHGEYPACL